MAFKIRKVKTTEVPLLLKWHPSVYSTEIVWNVEAEKQVEIELLGVNRRSQAHLLDVDSLEKFRVFLMRFGLKTTKKHVKKWVGEAFEKYGYGTWLNCTRLNYSLHGLCRDMKIPDRLLIQNSSECDNPETGMFSVKKALLNKYWSEGSKFKKGRGKSPLRFIKSYTVRRPI